MKLVLGEVKALALYFIFWYIICLVDRLIFIAAFFGKVGFSNFLDVFEIIGNGFSMDLSMISYICALPFLFYGVLSFFPKVSFTKKWLHVYTLSVLVCFFVISLINVNIYREWGDKISKRAIDAFLASPSGAVASAESTPIFVPVLTLLICVVGGYYLYLRIMKHGNTFQIKSFFINFLKFWFLAFVLFSFIRGGYGPATMNPSRAYFSELSFYNHAAVNTHWSLLSDYFTGNNLVDNPYRFYQNRDEINEVIKPIFQANPDSSIRVLTTDRPNVVLIILEGFVGDLVESMGGEKGIAPSIEKLIHEGIFFDNVYATSDRSDKGIVGVMSGFPAQGPESIIKHVSKHENIPAIGQELHNAGYATSFYHGGQSEFYNMKSYMLTHGISEVIDIAKFPLTASRTNWGVYDHIVFNRMIKDLNKEKSPFFSTVFTLINHEPFKLEGKYKFGDETVANKFRSTAYYTDSIVFDFINKAKEEPWYNNTVFVITADHGHRLPSEAYELSQPQRFHIPFIFFGEVVKPKYRGKVFHNIGSQTDIASTLLHQLKLPTERYKWSRNLFNLTTPQVALYNSKDAFGIITPEQVVSFENVGKSINYKRNKDYDKGKTDSLVNIAKAYFQGVYLDFLSY